MRKFNALPLLVFFSICIIPFIQGYTQSSAQSAETAKVGFDDPDHRPFFNYQKFLTEHGKEGLSAERWQTLPQDERARLLGEGEAFLSAKYTELTKKPNLTNKELVFLNAVWGSEAEKPAGPLSNHLLKKQSEATRKNLDQLPKKFERPEGTLSVVYDGDIGERGTLTDPVQTVGTKTDSRPKTSPPAVSERNGPSRTPPKIIPAPDKGSKPSKEQGIPWVAIGTLAIVGLTGMIWKLSKSATEATIDHFDLDIRLSHPEGPKKPPQKSTTLNNEDTCRASCAVTCDKTCGPTCERSCGRGTCEDSCPSTCSGTCQSTCFATCESTCNFTCKDTCEVTCHCPQTSRPA